MNAKQLHELMSRVTRDARPQHLTLRDLRWTDNGIIIRNANALLMCEASLTRWLSGQWETSIEGTGVRVNKERCGPSCDWPEYRGDSLIEALVNACVAVGGGA